MRHPPNNPLLDRQTPTLSALNNKVSSLLDSAATEKIFELNIEVQKLKLDQKHLSTDLLANFQLRLGKVQQDIQYSLTELKQELRSEFFQHSTTKLTSNPSTETRQRLKLLDHFRNQ